MVLRYWGYPISQRDIWDFLHPHEEPLFGKEAYVSMGELALVAMQMTKLRVTLATMEHYAKLLEQKSDFNPHVLLQKSICNDTPCMMYHMDHFYVVHGVTGTEYSMRYHALDSRKGGSTVVISESRFDHMWCERPLAYQNISIDTRYSLLIIRP